MGQEIVYCFKCLERLVTADLEKGQGLRLGNRVSCTKCLPELLGSLSPDEQSEFARQIAARNAAARAPLARGTPRASTPTIDPGPEPAPAAQRSPPWLILVAAGAALAVGAIVFILAGGGSEPPSAALREEPRPSSTAASAPAPSAKRPATTGRAWRPIFDGRTLDFMELSLRFGWRVENGALVHVSDGRGKTEEEFGDGEIRIRFEAEAVQTLYFNVRHGPGGFYSVKWNYPASFKPFEGKPRELVFTCRGDSVTAAFDDHYLPVQTTGSSRKGSVLFNARAKMFRILSIEFRELP